MKRFAYYIACCSLVALCGCSYDDIDDVAGDLNNGKITIEASLGDLAITRAEDTSKERTVEYIDVFAVDEDDNIAYYERNTSSGNESGKEANGAGKLTLNAARRTKIDNDFVFAQGEKYKFYLVANSTVSEETMGGLATLRDLELLVQDNSFDPGLSTGERQTLLHLSGTSQGTNEDGYVAPQTFLMDAVATDANGNDEWVVNPATGNLTNLELAAEFKRAAAKIVVNITQGEDVEFHTELEGQDSQYDFYKLPSNTFVLPSEQPLIGIELINTAPMGPNAETFIWGSTTPAASNTIQIIGYAYAHQWSDVDLTNETSLILNIPMMWNKDDSDDKSKEAAAPSSWYKVPLSKEKKFERNKCYVVNITINAVGAANRSTAIELRDIEYVTLDWEDVNIEVGNEDEKPEYLVLNRDTVNIYNLNYDYTQLEFSSSSFIPNNFANENSSTTEINNIKTNGGIILVDAYYYNYLDQKVELSTTAGDKYEIYADISSSAEQEVLNGKISIESPFVGVTEQEILAQFGPAPVVPAQPTVPVNPVPEEAEEVDNPGTQSEYATAMSQSAPSNPTNNQTYYTYRWNNNQFQRRTWTYSSRYGWQSGNWTSNWTGRQQMLTDYNNAVAAWEAWEEWNAWNSLSQAEKETIIAQYNADVASYDERLAYYNQQVAAKEIYDQKVAEFSEGKEEDSHSNAIRYLEFEVYNQTGQMAKFVVAQYPTLYITNEMGYYSYRSDFGGTTYDKVGNPNRAGADWNGSDWDYTRSASNSNFFGSKVAVKDGNSYAISYYYWNEAGNSKTVNAIGSSLNNPRMYHVHVTATSSNYTIGKPRLDSEGFTESSLENSRLVSPSFMIASQLGATQAPDGGITQAKKHCEQYVEITADAVYDDWRLPTAAEIEIIASHQDTSDAMATVMTGGRYFCSYNVINGEVVYYQTTGKGGTTTAVRCVRDAY